MWCLLFSKYCLPGWATGTIPTSISSYADFITRPAGKESVITFEKVSSDLSSFSNNVCVLNFMCRRISATTTSSDLPYSKTPLYGRQ